MKNTVTEVKNMLDKVNSRLDDAEKQVNYLEVRVVEITQSEEQKEKKNEDSLRDLWDNTKYSNICIIGSQKEKRERKGQKVYLRK